MGAGTVGHRRTGSWAGRHYVGCEGVDEARGQPWLVLWGETSEKQISEDPWKSVSVMGCVPNQRR